VSAANAGTAAKVVKATAAVSAFRVNRREDARCIVTSPTKR
jgi:hypothetical protein